MLPQRLYTTSRAGRPALENIGVSTLDVFQRTASLAYDDSPSISTFYYNYFGAPITKEDYDKQYGYGDSSGGGGDSGIPYNSRMTMELADFLHKKKQQREFDEYVMSLGRGDFSERTGQFIVSMIASNLTPINLAASFVPIGGQARWALVASKYGKFNARLAKGFVGGAVGQASLEPCTHYERGLEGREYDIADSANNVLISGLFGASLQAASFGLSSGFSKLKSKYYSYTNTLNPDIATGNPVIDRQFKDHLNNLEDRFYPSDINIKESGANTSILEAQMVKQAVWQEGREKFPEFFDLGYKISEMEELLHNEFATEGDDAKLPQIFARQLDNEKAKLAHLKEQYSVNTEFSEIRQKLSDLDSGILNLLENEQHQMQDYKVDPLDLYIASRQVEEGGFIDLENPNITEFGSSFKHANEAGNQMEKAISYIDRFEKAPSEGIKDFLKQANLRQITISEELSGGLLYDLKKAGLLEVFEAKSFHLDIARELYNITAKSPEIINHNHKYTGNKHTKDIASIIHKWQTKGVDRAHRSGADINQLPGYITRQSHDPIKVRQAGFEKWRDFIVPLLDFELIQKAMDGIPLDLHQIYLNLATDRHLYELTEYLPRRADASVAKYFNSPRKLHFKSASSWFKYNEQFGTGTFKESVVLNLDRLGKNIGLLETLGNDPKEALNYLKNHCEQKLQELAASGDQLALSEMKFFNGKKLDDIMDLMMGNTAPENPTLGSIERSLRGMKVLSSLGNVTISSIPDMAVFTIEQVHNNIPMLNSFGNILKALTYSFSSKEKKELAGLLGVVNNNFMGRMVMELNGDFPVAGLLSKTTNLYMKLNLMEWWNNSFKSTLGLLLSNNLAQHLKLPYAKTPKQLRDLLFRYNIDESNWDIYRSFITKAGDGREYVIPGLDLDKAKGFQASLSDEISDELRNNLQRYLRDRVDTGIPEAHAAEKYFTTLGTNSGTPLGVAIRLFMQFKQYPITYMARPLKDYALSSIPLNERTGTMTDITRGIGNEIGGAIKGKPPKLMMLFGLATAGGYLSIAAKNLLNGKEIPEIDEATVKASILKGGGAGILGDFFFGHYNRYGQTFWQTMAGPVPGDFADVMSIYGDIIEGEEDRAAEKTKMLLCRNVPGRNLFYLPLALKVLGSDPEALNCYNAQFKH